MSCLGIMSARKTVSSVLEYLKSGKVLGTRSPQILQSEKSILKNESTALRYKSYYPSLRKEDFISILPERILAPKADSGYMSDDTFQLVKCRDPKFFQFQDSYILLFRDNKAMRKYYESTSLSRIFKVRVKFNILPKNDGMIPVYSRYAKNLESAFQGGESYFKSIKEEQPIEDLSEQDLILLQKSVIPIEERSALIWNLPIQLKSHNIMDKFWFYDIKHCFKLYWDTQTGKTLHYVAFNDPVDCLKLKRNFHGVNFDDCPQYKLLVETLNGEC
ncbi:hypothetical protein HG535_0E01240 [Zygotorulaspora mrakii]|uniref:Uncharacterized protein n=1 Tax=Zygotorulaspora mrakii TaxID=42260 RepID=A0A7H9B338_ZYGMR|nr:uncharacterized protein HG535_0E01240 [Zygotorulaspora mrakii]QLG73040.1 hypothetical protein HG535_0E01240 [Zygotorulaspora mrakii]